MINQQRGKLNSEIGGKNAGIMYSLTMLVIIFVAFLFSMLCSVLGESFTNNPVYNYINYGLGGICVMIAFFIYTFALKKPIKENVSVSFNAKKVPIVLCVFLGMYFGLGNLNFYFSEFLVKLGLNMPVADTTFFTTQNFVFLTVFVALIPAIFEELVFRGIIFSSLKNIGDKKAIFISALAFSLYHMSPQKTIYQFCAGVIFALLVLWTDSIIFTMLIHFLNNFIVIVNYCFLGFEFSPLGILISTILGTIVLIFGIVFVIKNTKFSPKNGGTKNWWIYGLIGLFGALLVWIGGLFA